VLGSPNEGIGVYREALNFAASNLLVVPGRAFPIAGFGPLATFPGAARRNGAAPDRTGIDHHRLASIVLIALWAPNLHADGIQVGRHSAAGRFGAPGLWIDWAFGWRLRAGRIIVAP
jgi:hypothetical protein